MSKSAVDKSRDSISAAFLFWYWETCVFLDEEEEEDNNDDDEDDDNDEEEEDEGIPLFFISAFCSSDKTGNDDFLGVGAGAVAGAREEEDEDNDICVLGLGGIVNSEELLIL